MTESEWRTCRDAHELFVEVVRDASPRKIRLLGCACVEWAWTWGLNEDAPEAVRVAEAFADGRASEEDLVRAADDVAALRTACEEPYRPYPRTCELTELLASPRRCHEVLEELHAFAADMSVVAEPGWEKVEGFVRDVFGNPFRPVAVDPAWLTSDVVALAEGIYEERAFDRLPILADALQDAGCDNDVLNHCRSEGPHVRGCWVVDVILGKS